MSNADAGIAIGDRVPEFTLPDTAGADHSLPGAAPGAATVVYWTCNHCPYALAWHERIQAVVADYVVHDVRFLAINSNDSERYPADAPEAMAARVAAGEFEEPYLIDADQSVARAFGAERTPDVFVFSSQLELIYRGAPDADHDDPTHNAAWLRGAIDAALAGQAPEPAETDPVGCTIKWKA